MKLMLETQSASTNIGTVLVLGTWYCQLKTALIMNQKGNDH